MVVQSLTFSNEENLKEFMKNEKKNSGIELVLFDVYYSKSTGKRVHMKTMPDGVEAPFEKSTVYVCSRNGAIPEKGMKRTKKLGNSGCQCQLTTRKYVGYELLYAEYNNTHSHPIGWSNVKFTRISQEVKDEVKFCLERGLTFSAIRDYLDSKDLSARDSLISDRDIRALQLSHEKTKYSFSSEDSVSTSIWAQKLSNSGELMYHNQRHDIFELAICPSLGQIAIKNYNKLICLDSTHRTNSYNYNLFTLVAQNEFGQGIPVAFLISSDGKTETLTKFLTAFKSICPTVGTFMTDNDEAEINAIRNVFPESNHLLCWWHVLKAWKEKLRQVGCGSDDPLFWEKLVAFLKSSNNFDEEYNKIVEISSPQFAKYLDTYWVNMKEKWAHSFRMNIPMFKQSNTNMLIESFHNLLKTNFFSGKVNRRVDRLIYILVGPIQRHFIRKERSNAFEMKGPSPKTMILERETEKADLIPTDSIIRTSESIFEIESASQPGLFHEVNVSLKTCTCYIFRLYDFCKHLFRCINEADLLSDDEEDEEDENEGIEVVDDNFHQNNTEITDFPDQFDHELWQEIGLFISSNYSAGRSMYHSTLIRYNQVLKGFTGVREKIAPNQSNSGLTIHPFKPVKARGRPKQPKTTKKNKFN